MPKPPCYNSFSFFFTSFFIFIYFISMPMSYFCQFLLMSTLQYCLTSWWSSIFLFHFWVSWSYFAICRFHCNQSYLLWKCEQNASKGSLHVLELYSAVCLFPVWWNAVNQVHVISVAGWRWWLMCNPVKVMQGMMGQGQPRVSWLSGQVHLWQLVL